MGLLEGFFPIFLIQINQLFLRTWTNSNGLVSSTLQIWVFEVMAQAGVHICDYFLFTGP